MANGYLAKEFGNVRLPLMVMQSRAGYYIGTMDDEGPFSRESLEYYSNKEDAELALSSNSFTQMELP